MPPAKKRGRHGCIFRGITNILIQSLLDNNARRSVDVESAGLVRVYRQLAVRCWEGRADVVESAEVRLYLNTAAARLEVRKVTGPLDQPWQRLWRSPT